MKITLLAFAVVYLAASTFADSTVNTTTEEVSTSPATPKTTISSTPIPTPTTTSSPTPTAPPTTNSTPTPTAPTTASTDEPTTASTDKPTTASTDKPTTTSTDKPTTTSAPETTSVLSTSSTEPPTTVAPIPNPETGHWKVTDGNTTCIRANLAIRFKISDNKYIALSPNATTEGSKCNTSDGVEILALEGPEKDYAVAFVFEKNSKDKVYVKNISFTEGSTEAYNNDTLFEVKTGNSYLCKTPTDIMLGNVTMHIVSVQIQAFGAENNKDFGSAEECAEDSPINDVVPIAVGIALLALVVVVLIAYLIGRRRSRQKGYQSV